MKSKKKTSSKELTKEQTKVWDKIAPEWDEYKKIPSQLSEEFLAKQTGTILDLGSGSGRHLTKIKKGEMVLVDFSPEMIKLAKAKAEKKKLPSNFHVADIAKLPFEDNLFDGAISISSLHCTPKSKHEKIVSELYRVLKPKAKALIGVWNQKSKRFGKNAGKEKWVGWRDKGKRYYYLFTEPEIHKLFKDAVLKIISAHNSEMMINFIVQK